jgi:hypothetical protein
MQELSLNVVNLACGIGQIISGIFLVRGIMVIRRFFRGKQIESTMNTKVLGLHSIAFGLFLVTVVADFGSFALYVSLSSFEILWHLYLICAIFMIYGSFIAQALLCLILWDLGIDKPKPKS